MNNFKNILPSLGSWSETRIQENALSHPARGVQGFRVVLGRLKATGVIPPVAFKVSVVLGRLKATGMN